MEADIKTTSNSRIRVLAVDDDITVRKILEDMLSGEYYFRSVVNIQELYEVLPGYYPDILLLDLVLPDGNGIDVCKEIRQDSQYENLFVLMITATDDEDTIIQSYEAGANDYIRKPFVPFEVKSKIRNCTKIISYQKKLYSSFNYQLDFSKKLFKMNWIIQRNINVTDFTALIRDFSSLGDILDIGYIELIRINDGKHDTIYSEVFRKNIPRISSSALMKKTLLLQKQSTRMASFLVKTSSGTRIFCCYAPILISEKVTGYLLFERDTPFDQDEKNLISICTDFLGVMTERIRIQKELDKQYSTYKNEIAKVRKIQVSLLPNFEEVTGFNIASIFLPAEDISGDFYDGFFLDDDVYQIVLCDVSGHGVASSFIGNEMRSLFRTFSLRRYTPAFIVKTVNDMLTSDLSGLYYFGTVIVCQINIKTGEVLYASGGHPPAIYYNASLQSKRLIGTTGPLIGLFQDSHFTDKSFKMESGDTLLLYTDGVIESHSAGKNGMYGEKRLIRNFMDSIALPSKDLVLSIVGTVYEYAGYETQKDDITMICIKKE